MENLLIVIAVALVSLVLGYLFMKHYNSLDRKFFGQTKYDVPGFKDGRAGMQAVVDPDPDYEPFGRTQMLLCIVPGALLTGLPIVNKVFYLYWSSKFMDALTLLIVLFFIMTIAFNLYQAVARMKTSGKRVGKFFFLTFACAVGAGIGALGSAVIFAAVVLYIIVLAFGVMLGGGSGSGKKRYVLEDGTEVEKNTGMFGDDSYHGTRGEGKYDRSGNTFTKE